MLTYAAPAERTIEPVVQNERPWLLLLLSLFWLLPGLIGHDPWKPLENQSVAVIQSLLQSAEWSLPTLAGAPYLEHAPLYYWCAAALGRVLGWFGVPLHDAARLTTGLWMALAMWGVGLAGRELFGKRYGRVAVVALISGVGMLQWGHHVSPAVVALAAFAWQLYALALARRMALAAGAVLGLSWLVLLLGATWSEVLLSISCALLLAVFPAWRRSGYLAALLAALVIAVPLGLLWPLSLQRHAPEAFDLWWHDLAFGPYGGATDLRFFHKPGYLPSIVMWFAFPVLPMAVWSLWLNRRNLFDSCWVLAGLQAVAVVLWLIFAGEPGEAQALMLLVPLSVLAAASVDELRRGAASSLYWFGILTFGTLALALWGIWLAMLIGWPVKIVAALQAYNPANVPISGIGLVFAIIVSAAWVRVLFRSRPLGRRAITGWACSVTLVWGVLVGLWQPWLDSSKSYRKIGQDLSQVVAARQPGCVLLWNTTLEQRGGLIYFSGLDLQLAESDERCPWLLAQEAHPLVGRGLTQVWSGRRPGENSERFYLYRRGKK